MKNNNVFSLALYKKPFSMRGAAMIETIITFPILLLIGFGIVHLGLVYQAKSNLEYAAFMGARQSAVTNMSEGDVALYDLKHTIRCRMAAHDPLPEGVVCHDALSPLPNDELAKIQIQFTRPTNDAFLAWGENSGASCPGAVVGCSITNNNVMFSDPASDNGSGTGVNLQDANIMTISVRYRVDTRVPFMNNMFALGERAPGRRSERLDEILPGTPGSGTYERLGSDETQVGVWIQAESTMIMQSDATISSNNFCAIGGYC